MQRWLFFVIFLLVEAKESKKKSIFNYLFRILRNESSQNPARPEGKCWLVLRNYTTGRSLNNDKIKNERGIQLQHRKDWHYLWEHLLHLHCHAIFEPVSHKRNIKYPKYQVFKHTTESKNKNMVGANPEVNKRKALQATLNPTYFSNSTVSPATSFQYTLVQGKSTGE